MTEPSDADHDTCNCLNCQFYRVLGEGGMGILSNEVSLLQDEHGNHFVEVSMRMIDNGVRLVVEIPSDGDALVDPQLFMVAAAMSQVFPQVLDQMLSQEGGDE